MDMQIYALCRCKYMQHADANEMQMRCLQHFHGYLCVYHAIPRHSIGHGWTWWGSIEQDGTVGWDERRKERSQEGREKNRTEIGQGGEQKSVGPGWHCERGTGEKKEWGREKEGREIGEKRGGVGARKEGKTTMMGAYDNMEAGGCIKANARLADKRMDGRTEGRRTPSCPPRPSSRPLRLLVLAADQTRSANMQGLFIPQAGTGRGPG